MNLPLAHLLAEAEAFPLHATVATAERLVGMSQVAGLRDDSAVWSELESLLRGRSGGRSIATLESIRDAAWFSDGQEPPLVEHLLTIASRYLSFDSKSHSVSVLRSGSSQAIAGRVAHLRWLTLALPCDVLVAAAAARAGALPSEDRVNLLDEQLREVLRKGVAETHLHIDAGLSFAHLWNAIVSGHGAGVLPSAPQWTQLRAALIVRLLLARTLSMNLPISKFREETEGWLTSLTQRVPQWPAEHGSQTLAAVARSALEMVHDASVKESVSDPQLVEAYKALGDAVAPYQPPAAHGKTTRPSKSHDPVAPLFGNHSASAETVFAASALHALRSAPKCEFARLFFQLQRIRTRLFRSLVVEPGTAGLDWFTRSFRNIRPFRKLIQGNRYNAVANAAHGIVLSALEARMGLRDCSSPMGDVNKLVSELEVHCAAPCEVACIVHFIKDHCTNSHRSSSSDAMRFSAWFTNARGQADAIAAALRRTPSLLRALRAVDVASAELSIPTWPFRSLFDSVRRAAKDAAQSGELRLGAESAPIRATFHAGEDFRSPLEGLRRVHELVEFAVLLPGDRIGHALSLGMDWDRWVERNRTIAQPAADRLDDLLWELDRYTIDRVCRPRTRLQKVAREAKRLAVKIYGKGTRVADVRRVRHLLASGYAERSHGFPQGGRDVDLNPPCTAADRVIGQYLNDEGVALRGASPELLTLEHDEVLASRLLQAWVCHQVVARGITVEACPSSNLVVLGGESVQSLPMFQLSRPGRGAAKVRISINSDDPLTFATCLADEYAYAYYALVGSGACVADALSWVDEVRQVGLESRFSMSRDSLQSGLSKRPPLD